MEQTMITQADADQIYLYQVQQTEIDRRMNRAVTLLQGIAALLAIAVAIRLLMKSN